MSIAKSFPWRPRAITGEYFYKYILIRVQTHFIEWECSCDFSSTANPLNYVHAISIHQWMLTFRENSSTCHKRSEEEYNNFLARLSPPVKIQFNLRGARVKKWNGKPQAAKERRCVHFQLHEASIWPTWFYLFLLYKLIRSHLFTLLASTSVKTFMLTNKPVLIKFPPLSLTGGPWQAGRRQLSGELMWSCEIGEVCFR